MRNIALLVRKDFVSTFSGYGPYIAFLLVWIIIAPLSPNMIPMWFTMCLYILVLALFQSEENDLVCNIRAILPIRKEQAVIARYLYGLAVLLVMAMYVCIACPLINLLTGRQTEWGTFLLIGLVTNLLLLSVSAPLMYKMGMAKMRMVVMGLYVLFIVVASSLSPLLIGLDAVSLNPSPGLLLAGGLGGGLLLTALSMGISIRIVK